MEVTTLYGNFKVPCGTKDWALVRAADEAVKKFILHFEKEGWTLESRPKVKLVPTTDAPTRWRAKSDEKVTLLIPEYKGVMRSDHPWVVPDKDFYEVRAVFSRPPRTVTLDIKDETLEKWLREGTMPSGMVIR